MSKKCLVRRSIVTTAFGLVLSFTAMAATIDKDTISTPAVQYGHGALTSNVAYSPDAAAFLAGSQDGKARMFNINTGAVLLTLTGHADAVTVVAYSADITRIVTGSKDKTAKLWNADTGDLLLTCTGHTDTVTSAVFSQDGALVFTGSTDNTAKLWDATTGLIIRTFNGHQSYVESVALSSDGSKALTGCADGTVKLWTVATAAEIRTLTGHAASVNSVSFSADGTKVLTGSSDKTAKLWETATGAEIRTFTGHTGAVNCAALSADGTKVLTSSSDQTARLWDAGTGLEILSFTGHRASVTSAAFSPDGGKVLTGSPDNTVKLWHAAAGTLLRTFTGFTSFVTSAVFSPDGTTVLTGSSDTAARLWNTITGTEIRAFTGHTGTVTSVAFSPDGTKALTGSMDDTARLWNTATGEETHTLTGHASDVNSVAFSPDGTMALTGSSDTTAALWDVATGLQIRAFHGHSGFVGSVAFSPDGTRVLTASADPLHNVDNTVKLWNAETGDLINTFSEHTDWVMSVQFSPDGKRALSGSKDKTAVLFDLATGSVVQTFSGHTALIYAVAFSPDGTKVLTGSADYTARLWDAASGTEIRTFALSPNYPVSVAFSPDGARVLTGSGDGLGLLWPVSGQTVTVAVPNLTGQTQSTAAAAITAAGLTAGSVSTLCSDTVAAGLILSQSPMADVQAPLGGAVTFVVSSGTCNVAVPDLTGLLQADADAALTAVHLFVGQVTEQCNNNVAAGRVAGQNPTAQTMVPPGSGVALLISSGPCGVTVPNVTGQTLANAGSALGNAHLAVGAVSTQCSNTVAAGSVISQRPAADQQALYGSAVALVVSSGLCDVSVPDVLGRTQTAASAAIADANLAVGDVTRQCNNTVAAGLVISQIPTGGEAAPFGSAVALTVSTGPCSVVVPNVAGLTQAAAGTALTGAGLTTGVANQECSGTVAAGLVIRQTPAAEEQALYGSAVALVVSTGECTVTVPNVAGQTQAAAEAAIAAVNLAVGTVTRQCSNTAAAGRVISQTPGAGESATLGSPVAMVVSTGACKVPVPDLIGKSESAASTILAAAHLAAGAITRQCNGTAPAGTVISQVPAGGQEAFFDSTVALTVSAGPCSTTVPDVVGQAQSAAATALTGAYLAMGTVTRQCSDTVAGNSVISQNPTAGTAAANGDAVALVVSSGPCSVAVPELSGLSEVTAMMGLTAANLTAGTVTRQCSGTVAPGLVLAQNPAAGAQALLGSAVMLYVSTGACTGAPPTEAELRAAITASFDAVDINHDGGISFAEALIALPGLTQPVFNAVDADGNGQVTLTEAEANGTTGCPGCAGGKSFPGLERIEKSLGDIFLGTLSLAGLLAFSTRRS